jgi:UDP-GlcNAc3NAcA epimerase
MLAALEPLIADATPDALLVYGDTNSTLAGALAGAQARVPVAHVEAGMRSFDWDMPEELNRVLTDSLAALLLCSSQTAADNLEREHVHGRVELVGDVMVDVAALVYPRVRDRRELLNELELAPGSYVLATAHRAGNVDDPARLALLVELLSAIPGPLVLPLHPRTRARLEAAGLLDRLAAAPGVGLLPPLGYVEFGALLCNARAVLTDSGGVQKEAYLAGVPCVTMRDRTEWVETVDVGWNTLVDLDRDAALVALARGVPRDHPSLYGDGQAGRRVVEAMASLAP